MNYFSDNCTNNKRTSLYKSYTNLYYSIECMVANALPQNVGWYYWFNVDCLDCFMLSGVAVQYLWTFDGQSFSIQDKTVKSSIDL